MRAFILWLGGISWWPTENATHKKKEKSVELLFFRRDFIFVYYFLRFAHFAAAALSRVAPEKVHPVGQRRPAAAQSLRRVARRRSVPVESSRFVSVVFNGAPVLRFHGVKLHTHTEEEAKEKRRKEKKKKCTCSASSAAPRSSWRQVAL